MIARFLFYAKKRKLKTTLLGYEDVEQQEAHGPWRSAWQPVCLLTFLSQKSHIYSLSTPGGSKLSLFSLYGQWFPRYGPDFQNCHIWAWNLATGQSARGCTYTLFLPHGVEIQLSFALRAAVSEIQTDFQNCHIWAWNLAIGQSSRSCTYTCTIFLPKRVKIELVLALRAAVSEIRTDFQNCHISAWNFAIGQSSRLGWKFQSATPPTVFIQCQSNFMGHWLPWENTGRYFSWQLVKFKEICGTLKF